MGQTLDLNTPAKVTLGTIGDVFHVYVPEDTKTIHIASTARLFLDFSPAADGDPGSTDYQFPVGEAARLGISEAGITAVETWRLVPTEVDQDVWILARGPSPEEVASGLLPDFIAAYLARIRAHVPEAYSAMEELLAMPARALAEVRASAEVLRRLSSIGRGSDRWLTMHGAGLGVHRATNENDVQLRRRIRSIGDRVTKPAILAAVNAALADVTTEEAELLEWFEGPGLADDGSPTDSVLASGLPFHLGNPDQARMIGPPGSFVIQAPRLSGAFTEDIYFTIVAIVDEYRAAGTDWALAIPPN